MTILPKVIFWNKLIIWTNLCFKVKICCQKAESLLEGGGHCGFNTCKIFTEVAKKGGRPQYQETNTFVFITFLGAIKSECAHCLCLYLFDLKGLKTSEAHILAVIYLRVFWQTNNNYVICDVTMFINLIIPSVTVRDSHLSWFCSSSQSPEWTPDGVSVQCTSRAESTSQ